MEKEKGSAPCAIKEARPKDRPGVEILDEVSECEKGMSVLGGLGSNVQRMLVMAGGTRNSGRMPIAAGKDRVGVSNRVHGSSDNRPGHL